jgi:hypothetical protein
MAGILDLDHVGAHVAEEHRAERARQHAREVDDFEIGKRERQGRTFRHRAGACAAGGGGLANASRDPLLMFLFLAMIVPGLTLAYDA